MTCSRPNTSAEEYCTVGVVQFVYAVVDMVVGQQLVGVVRQQVAPIELDWQPLGTATYSACLFSVFLLNSLTPDFAAFLFGRIDQTYRMDGPLLFLTMCTHIHRNHIAFVDPLKTEFA